MCTLLLSVLFLSQGMAARLRYEREGNRFVSEANHGVMGNAPADIFKAQLPNNGLIAMIGQLSFSGKKNEVLTAVITGTLVLIIVIGVSFIYVNRSHYKQQIKMLRDDLHEKEECLEVANEERDWLIKEVHHRVKNNLQIVMSLLNSQSIYEPNKTVRKAIRNSQHRMYAISLVHQKLYQADSLSEVDMVVYAHELVEYLTDAFEVPDKIRFELDMEPLLLDISMAVSFGLIMNEAISNTLKYAFPAVSQGVVSIRLTSSDQINYCLSISDNGIGIAHSETKTNESFGNVLMAGLARQLGGEYHSKSDGGVAILVTFSKRNEPIVV